jgi:hypothetical protein
MPKQAKDVRFGMKWAISNVLKSILDWKQMHYEALSSIFCIAAALNAY